MHWVLSLCCCCGRSSQDQAERLIKNTMRQKKKQVEKNYKKMSEKGLPNDRTTAIPMKNMNKVQQSQNQCDRNQTIRELRRNTCGSPEKCRVLKEPVSHRYASSWQMSPLSTLGVTRMFRRKGKFTRGLPVAPHAFGLNQFDKLWSCNLFKECTIQCI